MNFRKFILSFMRRDSRDMNIIIQKDVECPSHDLQQQNDHSESAGWDLAVSRAHLCPCTRQREAIEQRHIHDSNSTTGSWASSSVRAEACPHGSLRPCPGGETCWKHLRVGIHHGNIRSVCSNTTNRKRASLNRFGQMKPDSRSLRPDLGSCCTNTK